MNTLSFSASALAQSLSYALLYSLAQGAAIYGMLFIILKAVPGMNARVKYYLSFGALVLIFAWFANTCADQYTRLTPTTVYITPDNTTGNAGTHSIPFTVSAEPSATATLSNYIPHFDRYVPIILLMYCAGLFLMLLRFAVNMLQLRALGRYGTEPVQPALAEFVSRWQEAFGIGRKVHIYVSRRVSVPMMMGALKPIILLPVAAVNNLSVEEVEAIILHELAHIRRHDYLFNLVQVVIETLLFFNPFVWLASALVRREREHCCDDLVVSHASSPLHYARALAMLENNRINSNSLSLAATGTNNQLFHRIKRIMEMNNQNVSHSRFSALIVVALITTFLAAMISFTPSFAQKAKDGNKKPQKMVRTETVTVDSSGKKNVIRKTTTAPATAEDRDEDVDINISVNDDDKKHATAKVTVIATSDDKKGGADKKKVRKQVVISSANGAGFDKAELEEELANAKKEMSKVDWDEVRAEISHALAEVEKELDVEKLTREIKIEIKNELDKSKAELERAKRKIEKSRKEIVVARASAKSADIEINSGTDDVETMLSKMEKDGLINRNEKFRIEKENDELLINGKKQPDQVYSKYRSYLNGKSVIIKGGKGNLNININN